MRSLLIWVGVSRTTSCEKSVYMINKSVTMLEKLRHTVEMRVRRCHIHMRPNHMNAAVSKWHKLAHQFCEIDFIQKVLVDVAGSNTVQTHLGHGRSQSEVPLKGKNKALVKILGIVNTGRPLQVKYWGGGSRPLQPLRRWRPCYHQTIINTRSTEARHRLFKCLLLYVWRIEIDFNETI